MKSIAYLTIITNIIKCENMIAKSIKSMILTIHNKTYLFNNVYII